MRYITKGKVIDHDNNDREYNLFGVKVRGKGDSMVITGGSGYCLEIRENDEHKYVLSMVTEETILGSVAIKNYVSVAAWLKNFTYEGSEEL